MEGEWGAGGLGTCLVGAPTRWLAVTGAPLLGARKESTCTGKEREVVADGQDQQYSEREGETARAGG